MSTDARQVARWIVADIIADLSDRRGLRHEWDQIDAEVRREIATKWRDTAEAYIRKYEGKVG